MSQDPNLSKVASNDELLILIGHLTPAELKAALVEEIEEEGLTFNQRDFVQAVARRVYREQM